MYVRTDALLTTAGLVAAMAVGAVLVTTTSTAIHAAAVPSVGASFPQGNFTALDMLQSFDWAWLKRDPTHALNCAEIDGSGWLDWLVGDHYNATTDPDLRAFIEFNAWKNSLVIPSVIEANLPHFMVSWYRFVMHPVCVARARFGSTPRPEHVHRNYILGTLLYMVVGALWCVGIYGCFRACSFAPDQTLPTFGAMYEQVKVRPPLPGSSPTRRHPTLTPRTRPPFQVAQNAMFLYTWLPTWAEWLVERGYTQAYEHIDTVGLPAYLCWFVVYMVCVEAGVYWMHRLLHDIKPLYKHLHAIHHKYNKNNTLSPFASLAFHPVDGCLQALPYVLMMFVVPMHFLTHEILLFFTAIWSTSIHDTIQLESEPIMGAGYHEIHHTDYKHNYGQFTILFDWIFGTLLTPPGSKWAAWDSTGGESRGAGRTKWDKDRPDLEGLKEKTL